MSGRILSALLAVSSVMGCGNPVPTSPEATSDLQGFEVAGTMTERRFWHAAVLMQDGKVLITGGAATDSPGNVPSSLFRASTEIFDPATGNFEQKGRHVPALRALDMGILLPDGRVLIAGAAQAPLELYNPQTGRITPEPYDPAFAIISSMTLLGQWEDSHLYLAGRRHIRSPPPGGFAALPGTVRIRRGHTATRLRDGRVLIAGGSNASGMVKECEIYDPSSNTLTRTGDLRYERREHRAILLGDGSVLVIGGTTDDEGSEVSVTAAERYDPATGVFSSEGDPGTRADSRRYVTAIGRRVYHWK